MTARILIVEDENLLARNIGRFLGRSGHETDLAGTIAEGRALHDRHQPDIVVLDQNLPDGSGLDLLRALKSGGTAAKIVMITAYGSVQLAVEAIKAGADDYLIKPIQLEELGLLVERLVKRSQTEDSLAYYRQRERARSGLDRIIGASEPVEAMKARIRQILAVQARAAGAPAVPILIMGETGTGKELVARALHFDGPRAAEPFVELNCAALPDHLIESELFGHERGAFTDARERRLGLIQSADRGTLFLDEIGEMPLAAQAKLLKVLEDGKVRPLGGNRERQVDVQFVAATNATLEERVAEGSFRADLYYRLRAIAIETPPLRLRGDDILAIAAHVLDEHCRRYGRPPLALGPEAARALTRHPWPGNVRELRNTLEQAALLTIGTRIEPRDLNLREPAPLAERGATADAAAPETAGSLQSVERDLIVRALQRCDGNVTLAANELGISRDTLRYRMERHAIRREAFRKGAMPREG